MTNQLLQLTWSNKDLALIPTETGTYGYRWVSPSDPRYCETHTLEFTDRVVGSQAPKEDGVAYSERADLTPTDDNLLILGESGDVLEALTRVPELADKYAGQIKCIYIDPPFNTAQTFAHYEDNLQHSVWLTMMRDRLQHMYTLLSDEGSIWVHLDHVENHRMRVLLDEVFGPETFAAEVIWQKADSPRGSRGKFSVDHDVILVYSKTTNQSFNRSQRTVADNARFSNPDGDENGDWFSDNRTAPHDLGKNGLQVPSVYGIQHPLTGEMLWPAVGRQWAFNRDRVMKSLGEYADYVDAPVVVEDRCCNTGLEPAQVRTDVYDLVLADSVSAARSARKRMEDGNWPEFFVTEDSFGRKSYPPEIGNPPRTWWDNDGVGHNRAAKSEIKALFPGVSPFDTPKPERLLERVIHIATNPGDIVLDVFAGSGTTAAVAQKMGRRWVTCELQEDNFTKFTRPRLEKVVRGEDQGGITTSENLVPNAKLEVPSKNTVKDMKDAALLLKRVADQENLDEDSQKILKECKKLINPRNEKKTNWRGGGGFTVARLSPACFDFDETLGLTMLTDAATGDTLIDSVAANLNFYRTPDDPVFHGIRGRMRLVVVEGTLLTSRVNELLAELADGELLTIATTEPDEAIRAHLREAKRGCRLIHIPDDIFHPTTASKEA